MMWGVTLIFVSYVVAQAASHEIVSYQLTVSVKIKCDLPVSDLFL